MIYSMYFAFHNMCNNIPATGNVSANQRFPYRLLEANGI